MFFCKLKFSIICVINDCDDYEFWITSKQYDQFGRNCQTLLQSDVAFCILSGIEWEFLLLCVLHSTDIDKVWDLSYSDEFAMAPHGYFSLKCLYDISDGKSFLSHSLVLKSHRRLMGCFTCMWVPLSHEVRWEMSTSSSHFSASWATTTRAGLSHHDSPSWCTEPSET